MYLYVLVFHLTCLFTCCSYVCGVFAMVSCVSYVCRFPLCFCIFSALLCFFVLPYFTFVFLSTVLVCVVLVKRVASYCRSAFWYVLRFGVCVCVYVKQ